MGSRSKRAVAASLGVVAALLIGASAASAATYPSAVAPFFFGPLGPDFQAIGGIVASPEPKCIANRTIRVTLITGGGNVPLDVARSGRHGGWQARGTNAEFSGVTGARINLVKRTVGKGKKALRCGGDKEGLA